MPNRVTIFSQNYYGSCGLHRPVGGAGAEMHTYTGSLTTGVTGRFEALKRESVPRGAYPKLK